MCKSELYRQILGTVSQETEIPEERILSKAKNAEIVDARYLLVYFLWRQGLHAPVISSLMNFSRRPIEKMISQFDLRRKYVNRRGIPVIKTTGVTVNAADVVFSFQNHAFANSWYRGLVLVELSQAIPAGTTGTLPVLFETNGVTKNVTTYNGANVTVSDIPGTGVFQLFYDKQTDTLQLMTGAV